MRVPDPQTISAQAYLSRLADRGIEYVFANAGTDFAPIIESLSINANGRRKFPRVVTVPHENVAMAMAHGSRDCGHWQYRERRYERRTRQYSDSARCRPYADHRNRPQGFAQSSDSL